MTETHPRRRTPTRQVAVRRLLGRAALVGVVSAIGGCDFPTSLPRWDTRWLVPARSTVLTVDQLLPANVVASTAGSTFQVVVAPVTFSRSLLDFCGAACLALQGATGPKPAFTASIADTLRLPSNVAGATIVDGSVSVALTNGFAFDPLQPGAGGPTGTIAVTISSGSTTVGTLTLSGTSERFAPGTTITRSVPLSPAAVGNRLAIVVTLVSPAGDPVRVDTNERVTIVATSQGVHVSQVMAIVAARPVALRPFTVDLTSIDASIIDRVQGGALIVSMTNPFGVSGALTMTVSNAGMPISKPVDVRPGPTTQHIPLTRDEVKALLGRAITVNATGTLGAGTAVPLSAADTARVTTQLDLTFGTQG